MSVQQTIITGIKEQLYFQNYLVLPGFGGFVLKSAPAHISASGGLLVPPAKTVSFNAQLKQNDGVMTLWLQNKMNCASEEASLHLKEFAEFCHGLLTVKRRLSLDGIGFFYLDFENNVCFEPQQDANFLTDSFGFSPLSIKPLETEQTQRNREPEFIDRLPERQTQTVIPGRRKYSRVVYPILFSAILLSLLGLLVTNIKIAGELKSSMFEGDLKRHYEPKSYTDLVLKTERKRPAAYVADANGIATIRPEEDKSIAVNVVGENTHSGKTLTGIMASGEYQIVLGCFSVESNAGKMVKKLSRKRIKAFIAGRNAKGMYVVSNGGYSTKEEAIEQLNAIKGNFPNAWIKKEGN